MIPPFRPDGYLPIGAHHTDVAEVEARLVDAFSGSVRRRPLNDGWRRRRDEISRLVPIDREWVNGSFTTLKQDPGDIDVVCFVDHDAILRLKVPDRMRLFDLTTNNLTTRRVYGCDSYLVAVVPHGHPLRPVYDGRVGYWDRWWSHDRLGVERGYLEVRGTP